ncbi:MAG: hypothetical protein AAF411_08885 [Myxococcota bacterium]
MVRSLLGLSLLLVSASAAATVMVRVPLEDMVRDSQGVVRGRVTQVGTQLVIRGASADPMTVSQIAVDEWIVGEGGSQLRMREHGGSHGRGGMAVAATPRYSVGEEVIIVLEADPESDGRYHRTYAMAQGKFAVLRGVPGTPDRVVRDTREVGFARWVGGVMSVEEGELSSVLLGTFLARVRAAARLGTGSGAPLGQTGPGAAP